MPKAKPFDAGLEDVALVDPDVFEAMEIRPADAAHISLMEFIRRAIANSHNIEIRVSGSSVPVAGIQVGIIGKPLLPATREEF